MPAKRTPTSDARLRLILASYEDVLKARAARKDAPDDAAAQNKEARAITLLENSVIDWINDVWKT
jgi:hypothetical protein